MNMIQSTLLIARPVGALAGRAAAAVVAIISLTCAPAVAQRTDARTADARATEMKQQRATSVEVAAELASVWRRDPNDVASTLKRVGYTGQETASALRNALKTDGTETTQAILAAGFEADIAAAILLGGEQIAADKVAAGFAGAGVAPLTALGALVQYSKKNPRLTISMTLTIIAGAGYVVTANEIAEQMRQQGYGAVDVVGALATNGFSLEDTVAALLAAGYTAQETGAATVAWEPAVAQLTLAGALLDACIYAGFGSDGIADAFVAASITTTVAALAFENQQMAIFEGIDVLEAMHVGLDAMAAALFATYADIPTRQEVAVALAARLEENYEGYLYEQALSAFVAQLGLASFAVEDVAALLEESGSTAPNVAGALAEHFNLTPAANASVLSGVGFSQANIALALKDPLGATASQAWDALTGIGMPAGPGLVNVMHDADYEATDVGLKMKSQLLGTNGSPVARRGPLHFCRDDTGVEGRLATEQRRSAGPG
jgi:Holliday junction resolvasome RuvABC DNA-binding subunit